LARAEAVAVSLKYVEIRKDASQTAPAAKIRFAEKMEVASR
jgi:hypothetical protein